MCQPTVMISISVKGLSGPVESKRVLEVVKKTYLLLCCYEKHIYRSAMEIFENNMGIKPYCCPRHLNREGNGSFVIRT